MRVMVLGLRGFPNIQGGVEAHAEKLYPRIIKLGCEVEVIVRSRYMTQEFGKGWNGVIFKRLWAPRNAQLEAIIHTFLGVIYAAVRRPDVLHMHAIGPSIWAPLARVLGLKVVVTHHGPDYDRQKWGRLARAVLRLGERWGMSFAQRRIVISKVIEKLVKDKYRLDSVVIPNGVDLPQQVTTRESLERFGLIEGRYILTVSRLVPEKRHSDLIEAFSRARLDGWKLVVVGASDHPDAYEKAVLELIASTGHVISTGFQTGQILAELYTYSGLFVLPSSHEGLPIALLEALSYGLPVIASAIPANLEVGLPDSHYFPLGNVDELAKRIRICAMSLDLPDKQKQNQWLEEKYNWEDVAMRTWRVYQGLA